MTSPAMPSPIFMYQNSYLTSTIVASPILTSPMSILTRPHGKLYGVQLSFSSLEGLATDASDVTLVLALTGALRGFDESKVAVKVGAPEEGCIGLDCCAGMKCKSVPSRSSVRSQIVDLSALKYALTCRLSGSASTETNC